MKRTAENGYVWKEDTMEIDWDSGNKSTTSWNTTWNHYTHNSEPQYSATDFRRMTFGEHRLNYTRRKRKEYYKHKNKHEKYKETFVFKHSWDITALQTDPDGEFHEGDTGTGILQWDSSVHLRFRDDVFFDSHLKSAWCLRCVLAVQHGRP